MKTPILRTVDPRENCWNCWHYDDMGCFCVKKHESKKPSNWCRGFKVPRNAARLPLRPVVVRNSIPENDKVLIIPVILLVILLLWINS